jgi:hypothetical protein
MTPAGEAYLNLVKGIAKTFEAHTVLYAFSGALANAVWGVPRATKDLDMLIHVSRIALPNTVESPWHLGTPHCVGRHPAHALDEATRAHGQRPWPDGGVELLFGLGCQGSLEEALNTSLDEHVIRLDYQGMEVEVFLPYLPYHHDVLRRRVQVTVEGVPAYFVTAEDLVILKFLFHRAKDVADIQTLLAVRADRLDRTYLSRTLRSLLPPEDPRHRELEQWWQPPRT